MRWRRTIECSNSFGIIDAAASATRGSCRLKADLTAITWLVRLQSFHCTCLVPVRHSS